MNYKILVNKDNKIPDNFKCELVKIKTEYKKDDNLYLEKTTYENFLKFKEYGLQNNCIIEIQSAYRTHEYQKKLFDDLALEKGLDYALMYVAKPYTSEHETGLAIDLCVFKDNKFITEHELKGTKEIKWIHENCHKFGFILRYPENKTDITKYNYEPWHIRYVGISLARFLYENSLTLEEYYKQ